VDAFLYAEERTAKIMLSMLDATTKFSHLGDQASDIMCFPSLSIVKRFLQQIFLCSIQGHVWRVCSWSIRVFRRCCCCRSQ